MKYGVLIAVMWAALVMAVPAWASHQCIERPKLMGWLLDKYDERPWGRGVSGSGDGVHELVVSPTGTYTIVISRRDGLSCIVVWGKEWIPRPDDNSPTAGEDASHD